MATKIFRCTVVELLVLSLVAGQERSGGSGPAPPYQRISDAATKLLRKPRLGSAQLTGADGRTQIGRIVRVTDQFIALETSRHPNACKNVELSEIAGVKFFHARGEPGAGSDVDNVVGGVFLLASLAPFMLADAVAAPFKHTPLKPLRGTWEAAGPSHGLTSSLEFTGNRVVFRTTIRKRGRWSVERGELHLVFDGEPEWKTAFHFACEELVLDGPAEKFRVWSSRGRAAAPIVGHWRGRDWRLNIEPSGSLVEEKDLVREGSFQNSSTNVKMYWTDSTGPGDAEWIAQIVHRHIVVSIGGAMKEFHYLKPSFIQLDL